MFVSKNELTPKNVEKKSFGQMFIFSKKIKTKKKDPVPSIMHQLSLIVFSPFPSFSPSENMENTREKGLNRTNSVLVLRLFPK